MYFIQGDGDITLGAGIVNSDGSITINTISQRDGVYGPLIASSNPIWTSNQTSTWHSYYGGRIGLECQEDFNYFFAQTADGVKSSGKIKIDKDSKWAVYPIMAGNEFFFILLDKEISPAIFPHTFSNNYGYLTIAGYPLVDTYKYVIYRIDDNLAFQLVGHSLEQRNNGFLTIGYPGGQTDATPRYFDVVEPDNCAVCKVLSMSNPHWDNLNENGFTAMVKSSNYCYLYVHVKPGEYIESGYYRTVTTEDNANVEHGTFGKINLTESRKCSIYLYQSNLSNVLNYLDYGGFVFCFDREMEENGSLHEDIALNKGMTYLLSQQLVDSCFIIHNISSKDVFDSFKATAPYSITVRDGLPVSPTDEVIKDSFAAWLINGVNTSSGWVTYRGFYVVHPGEFIIDYDSFMWDNDFTLKFPLGDNAYILLIYNKSENKLTGELWQVRNEMMQKTSDYTMNIAGATNIGNWRNPMVMFYKNNNNFDMFGEYGIMAVSEVSHDLVTGHGYDISEELAFYDHWNFHGDNWRVDFIPELLTNNNNVFDAENNTNYCVDLLHGLFIGVIQFPSNTISSLIDQEKTEDTSQDYFDDYRNKPSKPEIDTTVEPPKDEPDPGGDKDTEYDKNDNNISNSPQIPDGTETQPSDQKPIYDNKSDNIDDPTPPSILGQLTGLYKLYLISPEQLFNLTNFLWSDSWLDIVKKYLFNSPLDNILSLSYSFILPNVKSSSTIFLHNLNSGASAQQLDSQIYEADFGYIDVLRNFASFMDYSPKTKIEIYLPFIGNQILDTNLVMGCRLHLKYMLDFLSGCCNAHLSIEKDNKKFVAYIFNGNFLTQLPISAQTYTERIHSLFSYITTLATKNPLMLMNLSPFGSSITQIGQTQSNYGAITVKEPYVTITRPTPTIAAEYGQLKGIPSQETGILSKFKGFTQCDKILLENVPATSQELDIIRELFERGVYV